jgi:hypothetical protein
MRNRIVVKIPLSGSVGGFIVKDTLTVQPPCFYCGSPVDTDDEYYYTYEGDYQIKYWGRGRKFGSPMLGDVVDKEGKPLKGKYVLKFPYCSQHIRPVKFFKFIDTISFIIGLILAAALLIFLAINEGLEGGELLLLIITIPIFLVSLCYFLGVGVKALVTLIKPEWKDYSLRLGHYGVQLYSVTTNGGSQMVGPITYTLTLAFSNPEGARRFIKENPQAKVTKGAKLLKNYRMNNGLDPSK